jgi:hypothetical protein
VVGPELQPAEGVPNGLQLPNGFRPPPGEKEGDAQAAGGEEVVDVVRPEVLPGRGLERSERGDGFGRASVHPLPPTSAKRVASTSPNDSV